MCGKTEAPARDASQWTEAYQKALDTLLPLMSADDVRTRYAPQITLQDMAGYASRPGAETERLALAKVLVRTVEQAQMPMEVRHWLVLQLERIGKAESVPLLGRLMAAEDRNLRDYARRALEKNPDPGATEVLLKELAHAKEPSSRIALITAVGNRRDATAVKSLVQALGDPDNQVAEAVAVALSRIGTQEAVQPLLALLDKPMSPLSLKAAQGLIDVAQAAADRKDTKGAAELFDALYVRISKPGYREIGVGIRAAAVTGLIACDPDRGTREIDALIRDDQPKIRAAAVAGARQSPSKAATLALAKSLPQQDPWTQVQVLGLIGDRNDPSCIDSVKGCLDSQDEAVCLASVDTLTRIGTEAAAKALLQTASRREGEIQKSALSGLAVMPGPQVEALIKAQAASGDSKARVAAILVLGRRHSPGAAADLFQYAAHPDETIRTASFQSLAEMADSVDLVGLADLVSKTQGSSALAKAVVALGAVLSKAKDKDAAAQVIIDRIKVSSPEIRLSMLASLSRLGGTKALQAVIEASRSTDAAVQEAGIRTLSEWPDLEAGPRLLAIASDPQTSLTGHVLAVRGALRLVTVSTAASGSRPAGR